MTHFTAEFLGTLILVLLGDGVVANVVLHKTKGHASGWIVISFGWALAVTIAVYCVGRFSGAHLNPAITLGLAWIDHFPLQEVPIYLAAQMLGAFAGACLVWLLHFDHWRETPEPADKLAVFCTGPALRNAPINFLCEVVGTGVLMLAILSLGANLRVLQPGVVDLALGFTVAFNPCLVGLVVASIGLSLGGTTGYAINPARDLGPRLAHALLPVAGKGGSDWTYAWIPVFGPIVGGVGAAALFRALGAG